MPPMPSLFIKAVKDTHVEKYRIFSYMCWYSESAADTSLAFGATRSGWRMNSKAFTILMINAK